MVGKSNGLNALAARRALRFLGRALALRRPRTAFFASARRTQAGIAGAIFTAMQPISAPLAHRAVEHHVCDFTHTSPSAVHPVLKQPARPVAPSALLDDEAAEARLAQVPKLREIAEARASLLALTQEVPHG